MRDDDDPADWWKPGYSIKRWLTIGILAVSLLSSGFWFLRNSGAFRALRSETTHEKQSLKVNINTASAEDLETLPGIGPARAAGIIAHRPYSSVDDLRKVSGIGRRQFEEMRPFVKVDGRNERVRPH